MASTELVSKDWFEDMRLRVRVGLEQVGMSFNEVRFNLWQVKRATLTGPKGGRPKTSPNGDVSSWSGFCKSVGLAARTADRWVADFETKLLERGVAADQIKELGHDEVLDTLVKPVQKMITDETNRLGADYGKEIAELEADIATLNEQLAAAKKPSNAKAKNAVAEKQDELDKMEKQLADTKANLKSARSAKKILEDSDKIVAKWGEGATIELTASILRSTRSRAKAAVRGLRNMANMIATAWDLGDDDA